MADNEAAQTPRRIIRILGGDLEASRIAGNSAEADIAREGDGVAMTTIEAGYDRDYYAKFLDAMREAIRNGEQPVFYIDSHGANDQTDGRHRIYLHAADAVFEPDTPQAVVAAPAVNLPSATVNTPHPEDYAVPSVPRASETPAVEVPIAPPSDTSVPTIPAPPLPHGEVSFTPPLVAGQQVPNDPLPPAMPVGMDVQVSVPAPGPMPGDAPAPTPGTLSSTGDALEPRGNQDYSQDTDGLLARMVADYQREYRAVHGASSVPPRVMFALSACFSEGALHDLPKEFLRQADFMVADSEERYSYQNDTARILPALARAETAEIAFLRQLTSPSDNSSVYAIPALATARGVLDGDDLRDRVGRSNFSASMERAQGNITKLPQQIRDEISQTLATLNDTNIESAGNARARALLGYMAHYDDRYTSYSVYRAQGQLLQQYYNRNDRSVPENVAMLMRMDENHRDMVMGISGLRIPSGYLQHPNITNAEGQTALMAAADSSNARGTGILLALGANPNIADTGGDTALFYAIRNGATDIAELLINAGADANHRNNKGDTLLHAAASTEYDVAALDLLNRGLDVNATNNEGASPLLQAALMGNAEVVDILISHGANVNLADKAGMTPVLYALSGTNPALADRLIAAGADLAHSSNDGISALHMAARGGHIAIVTRLLDDGANVNSASQEGYTALMAATAASEDNSETIQLLLTRGAGVNQRTATGYTALHSATTSGEVSNIRTLLDAGADVNARDNEGTTPILNAAFFAGAPEVQLLIDHGADINAADNAGATPLLAATANGDAASIALLQRLHASAGVADINHDGQLSDVEAQFFYLKKYLPGVLPKESPIDLAFDTDRNGVATLEELAMQLATHGVRHDEVLIHEEALGTMNRVAQELRSASQDAANQEVVRR